MLLRLLVGLIVAAILLLFYTQIVLPFIRGKRLFPSFRKDEAAAKRERVEALREEVEATEELVELTEEEAELKRQLTELEPTTTTKE